MNPDALILVFDNDTNRGDGIVEAVRTACAGVYTPRISVNRADGRGWKPTITDTRQAGWVLLHWSDEARFQHPLSETSCCVTYGGGGFRAQGEISGSWRRIHRPVMKASSLSRTEWRELCLWALNAKRDLTHPPVALLARHSSFLIALDILCQGFITANIPGEGQPVADDLHASRNRSHLRFITAPREWLLRGVGVDSLDELEERLRREWVASDRIEDIRRLLTEESAEMVTHPLVRLHENIRRWTS